MWLSIAEYPKSCVIEHSLVDEQMEDFILLKCCFKKYLKSLKLSIRHQDSEVKASIIIG